MTRSKEPEMPDVEVTQRVCVTYSAKHVAHILRCWTDMTLGRATAPKPKNFSDIAVTFTGGNAEEGLLLATCSYEPEESAAPKQPD